MLRLEITESNKSSMNRGRKRPTTESGWDPSIYMWKEEYLAKENHMELTNAGKKIRSTVG